MKIKEPKITAKACVIWMHGLGASAANMLAVATQLNCSYPIRHVCLEAPIRPVTFNNNQPIPAWYDIYGLRLEDREDHPGIIQSMEAIKAVIVDQHASGIPTERIFLAGFSQGSAMALFTGLQTSLPLAGLICLSGYLPVAHRINPQQSREIPIFIGLGKFDQVVVPAWTLHSIQWLQTHHYMIIEKQEYPMEHAICFDELKAISAWLTKHCDKMPKSEGDEA
jgi:phospholipase/carboxylesterase